MLNQTILIGRLIHNPSIEELESGKKYAYITIACPRSYKNYNGEYDTDFIKIKLFNVVAIDTVEYCRKGDLISVKGRIESDENNKMEIIADRIMVLSSKERE